MAGAYDYLFFTLQAGRAAHQTLGERLSARGDALLGRFSPQLGWAANEAAALLRAGDGEPEATIADLAEAPVLSVERRRLSPTVRPADCHKPRPGGIYVHRWFTVADGDVEAFIALSAQAWPAFEGAFAANIFGLFRAEPDDAERAAGESALLLLTRYDDHGVWEASRDPTTEAMQVFARRQALTRRTRACSSLLAGP